MMYWLEKCPRCDSDTCIGVHYDDQPCRQMTDAELAYPGYMSDVGE